LRDFPDFAEINAGGLLVLKNSVIGRYFAKEVVELLQQAYWPPHSIPDQVSHSEVLLQVLRVEALVELNTLQRAWQQKVGADGLRYELFGMLASQIARASCIGMHYGEHLGDGAAYEGACFHAVTQRLFGVLKRVRAALQLLQNDANGLGWSVTQARVVLADASKVGQGRGALHDGARPGERESGISNTVHFVNPGSVDLNHRPNNFVFPPANWVDRIYGDSFQVGSRDQGFANSVARAITFTKRNRAPTDYISRRVTLIDRPFTPMVAHFAGLPLREKMLSMVYYSFRYSNETGDALGRLWFDAGTDADVTKQIDALTNGSLAVSQTGDGGICSWAMRTSRGAVCNPGVSLRDLGRCVRRQPKGANWLCG
jgi:hypothetical protein